MDRHPRGRRRAPAQPPDPDATAPVNPDVSVFVDDVHAAHATAVQVGAEIVHPLTSEDWGVTRFLYRDPSGRVVNVGSHS